MTLLRSSFTTSRMRSTLRRALTLASSRFTFTIGSAQRRPFPTSSTLLTNSQMLSWSSTRKRLARKATVSTWRNSMMLMQPLRRSRSAATPAWIQMVSAELTGEYQENNGPKVNWPSTLSISIQKVQITNSYKNYFLFLL